MEVEDKESGKLKDGNLMANRIYPIESKLSVIDETTMVVTWKNKVLKRGTCYKLTFDSARLSIAKLEEAQK